MREQLKVHNVMSGMESEETSDGLHIFGTGMTPPGISGERGLGGKYETKAVRCLGIDPHDGNCSIAIVSYDGSDYRYIKSAFVESPTELPDGERYLLLLDRLSDIFSMADASVVCVSIPRHSPISLFSGTIAVSQMSAARMALPCFVELSGKIREAVGCKDGQPIAEALYFLKSQEKGFTMYNVEHIGAVAAAVAGLRKYCAIARNACKK